jgi:putative ABC transport system permease protein
MRLSEILRLVFINLFQNKFKVILTSIGIVVGAATIVMVLAIGRGGQMDVADQFKNLNAGAIDISYTRAFGGGSRGLSSSSGSGSSRTAAAFTGGAMPGGAMPGGEMSGGGATPGMVPPGLNSSMSGMAVEQRVNFERITLSDSDVEDLEIFVPDLAAVTLSYSTQSAVNGGTLESETTYTIAGVKPNYAQLSNLELVVGDFINDSQAEQASKVCILGASAAENIFGSATEAYDSIFYIDNRPYVVNGVLAAMGELSSGISPDEAVFIPYETGIKYITGNDVSPTITVIAQDVDEIAEIKTNLETVLGESYPNATFTIEDAGSKMEAARASNRTLTLLLFAMATIVFIVGGIGIMNVLFVSIKERTREIGILKSIGCKKRDILLEFLLEASFISIVGGFLGILASLLVTPVISLLSVRVEHTPTGFALALAFAILTGTAFGFYPAFKASRLIPVQALNSL